MAAEDRLTAPDEPEATWRGGCATRSAASGAFPSPPEERERLARRLLAICDLAKRDIPHATTRLDGFIAFLDGEFDTPSSDEFT